MSTRISNEDSLCPYCMVKVNAASLTRNLWTVPLRMRRLPSNNPIGFTQRVYIKRPYGRFRCWKYKVQLYVKDRCFMKFLRNVWKNRRKKLLVHHMFEICFRKNAEIYQKYFYIGRFTQNLKQHSKHQFNNTKHTKRQSTCSIIHFPKRNFKE